MQQPARKLSLQEAFELARKSQAEGQLDDARRLYERLLSFQPNHAGALTLLGSIAYQKGDDVQGDAYLDRAVDIYGQMLRQTPDEPSVRAALINQMLARGRTEEALSFIEPLRLQMNPVRSDPETFARTRKRAVAAGRPPIVINTVPKSASETIWNRLAGGLGMAQSHLSIGLFPDCCIVPYRMRTFMDGGVIAKEHIPASRHNVDQLTRAGIDRMVFHVRDPRQATLSWAHFVRDDVSMRLMAPIWRKVMPPAKVLAQGFEATLDWSIDVYMPRLIRFMTDWDAVSRDPATPLEVRFLSFESFRTEGDAYFREVLDFHGVDPASFDPGAEAEDVHYRKGELDEWRGVFTKAQAKRAWQQIPRDLAKRFDWRA